MELTEERVIPNLLNPMSGLVKEHLARYRFAAGYARGRVLDIACGAGYGLPILKKNALHPLKELIGVDLEGEAIRYAIDNYLEPGIDFFEADALDRSLKTKIGTFDTIISLETIEHLEDDLGFIANLASLLRPGGIAIISTPFGQGRGKPCSCPFHVHQYLEEEFVEVLQLLGKVNMFYQLDETIEKKIPGKKYYLMVAICQNI